MPLERFGYLLLNGKSRSRDITKGYKMYVSTIPITKGKSAPLTRYSTKMITPPIKM